MSQRHAIDSGLRELTGLLSRMGIPPGVRTAMLAMAAQHAAPAATATAPPQSLAEVAGMFLDMSLSREDVIGPGLICDPAWHMMLMLFAHADDARPVAAADLFRASGTAAAPAARYLKVLEKTGLILYRPDDTDPDRALIDLSARGHARMSKAIAGFCVAPPAAA